MRRESDRRVLTGFEVTALAEDQERGAGELLSRVFAADPIFVHVVPDAGRRAVFLSRFMAVLARRSRRLAVALVTAPELCGVSLWMPPEIRRLTAEQEAMCGLDRLPEWLEAEELERFEALFAAVERSFDEDAPEPC